MSRAIDTGRKRRSAGHWKNDHVMRGVNGESNDNPVAPLSVVVFATTDPGIPLCVMVNEPEPFAMPSELTATAELPFAGIDTVVEPATAPLAL